MIFVWTNYFYVLPFLYIKQKCVNKDIIIIMCIIFYAQLQANIPVQKSEAF